MMSRLLLAFLAGALSASLLPVVPLVARQPVPLTSPASVLEAVFDAARTGVTTGLPDLCPPAGDNDEATRRICELAADGPDAAAFANAFSRGRVRGPATLRAEVPFVYGPEGDQRERMELIQRDGRWYLFTF
jgi:hypothetical protein